MSVLAGKIPRYLKCSLQDFSQLYHATLWKVRHGHFDIDTLVFLVFVADLTWVVGRLVPVGGILVVYIERLPVC